MGNVSFSDMSSSPSAVQEFPGLQLLFAQHPNSARIENWTSTNDLSAQLSPTLLSMSGIKEPIYLLFVHSNSECSEWIELLRILRAFLMQYAIGVCADMPEKFFLEILSRHMYFFVFLNFKRDFFSWTFLFGASFICKKAHLCLHSGLTWRSRAKYIEWPKNMLKCWTCDFNVIHHLKIAILLILHFCKWRRPQIKKFKKGNTSLNSKIQINTCV